jgi:hypothetical protein
MSVSLIVVLVSALTAPAIAGQKPNADATQDWTRVRSVSNEQGGTMDFVVVPRQRQTERPYYERIANAICGSRTTCMVHFWTDRKHVPTSAEMSGAGLTQMTAQYERSSTYKAPVLRLACWLYTTQAEAESAKCFYLPGAKVPWLK